MERPGPVYTVPLFAPLLEELLSLLRGLPEASWQRPTLARRWTVHDIAAHLLDGDLRKIAMSRDGHRLTPDRPLRGARDLVEWLNRLNAGGVEMFSRLSPRLLTDLLEITGAWLVELLQTLPPHGPAIFPVAWAGEDRSENWMDIGREYTERWHHQMQIRDALGAQLLLEPRWMEPLLDLSMRALVPGYARCDAPDDTSVVIEVTGQVASVWSLVRETAAWTLYRGAASSPAAHVAIDADVIWRLFYNAYTGETARLRATVEGEERLIGPFFEVRSVMV